MKLRFELYLTDGAAQREHAGQMNSLMTNPVALTVFLPLILGLVLGAVLLFSRGSALVNLLGWATGLLFIYWLLEGVPPLPPIASKQKLGYLFLLAGPLGVAFDRFLSGGKNGWLAAVLPLIAVLVWLGWSKIISGSASSEIAVLMGIVVVVLLSAGMLNAGTATKALAVESQPEQTFLAPAAWMLTAIAGSIVSVAGLFLGMGQMLGAFAAMTGGVLLVSYAALLTKGTTIPVFTPASAYTVGFAISSTIILTTLFGPEPNKLSLMILSLTPLMPLAVTRWVSARLPKTPFLRPILAGAIIAIPAILASLFAILTGTSPFA